MNIVILDGRALNPGDLSWTDLEALGSCTVYDSTEESEILTRIGDAEIIFTNKVPVTAETILQSPNLKYIGVFATGYNVVDTAAAKEAGVAVTNIPAYSTESVAQMVFALLLEVCNHVGEHSRVVHAGEWVRSKDFCFWKYPVIELAGKTIGIVGFGLIGQAVARIARAFLMKVIVYTRTPDPALETDSLRFAGFEELLSEADIISLNCPLTPETTGLIDKAALAKMKPSAILINTARGGVIVEEDLRDALNDGIIAAAAVDVVSKEPMEADNPLLSAKNMIFTPHIAWAATACRQRLMDIAVGNLKSFLDGEPVNVV